jgi:exoribonuclease-2
MKQVLFEEDGASAWARSSRGGRLVPGRGGARQALEGEGDGDPAALRRAAALGLHAEAQKLAEPIDPQFLWEVCGAEEFGFDALAREYFGRAPTPQEAAAVALALHATRSTSTSAARGATRPRPRRTSRPRSRAGEEAPPAGAGRRVGERSSRGRVPEPHRGAARHAALQARQDEPRVAALDAGARRGGLAPQRCSPRPARSRARGLLPAALRLRVFPARHGFAPLPRSTTPRSCPQASVAAFSIDDEETTEIDDAFSVERLADGRLRVGVHIAAPALFFGRAHRARGGRARAALHGLLSRRQDHDAARGRSSAPRSPPAGACRPLALPHVDARASEIAARVAARVVHVADNLRLADLDPA